MTDVRPATLDDLDTLARIAAAGFYADPVMSWVFRDDARRRDQLTFIFTGLVREMLPDRGTLYLAGGASAAFWRDPSFEHGRTASDRVRDAGDGSVDQGPPPFAPDELERLGILGEAMMASHPHEPHWYLNVVSTLPEQQGRGLGAAVLRPVLDTCDAQGIRAYLESTNPRNHTLYRRQGFVDAGEIALPGGPSMTAMWRDPIS
jgi:ribosomal protein S18 acetylase RimI-like enzyme